MKYLKYIIIFVIIIIITLVIFILNINNENDNIVNISASNNLQNSISKNNNISTNTLNNINVNTIEGPGEDELSNTGDKTNITGNVENVTSLDIFYTIENAIQSYINNITSGNTLAVYNQLSSSYIANNNIDTSNVLNYVDRISDTQEFRAIKMNCVSGEIYNQYRVYGKLLSNTGTTTEIYIIVNLNTGNLRYSIVPQLNNYTDLSQIKISVTNEAINENSNNQANYIRITEEQYVKNIMSDYQKNALYDTENAYKSLDEEYSKERFLNYSDYFNYVRNNVSKIQNLTLVNYKKEAKSSYTQYTCTDNYGNVYTVKATGIMEYTIILDNYTLQTTSDINNYNNLTNKQKVENNIKKVISMINTCDYTHLYNLLYDGFKSNYFATQSDMEICIKQKFFDYNIISTIEVNESEEGIYICIAELKNRSAVAADTMTRTIVIQLGTGTDFEMSFDM